MPPTSGTASETPSTETSFVPSNLTQLVPSFDPSEDDVETWSKKVELLSKVWPKEKLTELITRLILNTKGSAFQKLQIHQDELLKNELKCVKKLVEVVGGQFGQIPLERRYEFAERALFRCIQNNDESNDSYLARADVAWTEVIARGVKLEELQAYVVLRGSLLNAEDKKRVLIEAGAEAGQELTMAKVSAAVRMLGAGFFQDYTGGKKTKRKTYDQTAFLTEEVEHHEQEVFAAFEDDAEEDYLDSLLQDGDDDAVLISEYESAINDTIQDDPELATALNAYADARRRLGERFRNRGFWPVRSGNKSSGKGKNNFKGKGKSSRRSLQDRILSSRCRICNKLGHWKAECPDRRSQGSSSSGPPSTVAMTNSTIHQHAGEAQMPSSDDVLLLEFMKLPETITETPLDEPKPHCVDCFVSVQEAIFGIRNRVTRGPKSYTGDISVNTDQHVRNEPPSLMTPSRVTKPESVVYESANSADIHFASHGSHGVVDLGASKTVIGSQNLEDLLQSLPETTKRKLSRCPCKMQFRFGNQGILSSEHALVLPVGELRVKIAIVPGNTPFLISNSFLRGMKAIIDTHNHTLTSPVLCKPVKLQLSPRGLFLIDMNEVIQAVPTADSSGKPAIVCITESQKAARGESHNRNMTEKNQTQEDNPVEQSPINHDQQQGSQADTHNPGVIASNLCKPSSSANVDATQSRSCLQHGRFGSSSPEGATSRETSADGYQSLHSRGPSHQDHRVWINTCGTNLPAHVGYGAGVDHLVCEEVFQVSKTGSSTFRPICGVADHTSRRVGSHGTSDLGKGSDPVQAREPRVPDPEPPKGQSQSQEQDNHGSQLEPDEPRAHPQPIPGGRVRVPTGRVGSHVSRSRSEQSNPSRCTGVANQDVEPGECIAAGDFTLAEAECFPDSQSRGTIGADQVEWNAFLAAGDPDCEQGSKPNPEMCRERKGYQAAIKKITKEYEGIQDKYRSQHQRKTPNQLFEVFCGPQSRLTQQVINLGHQARRFALPQTDLMTADGRRELFEQLFMFQPEHLWFSPECGPWSAWSNLNQSRSCEAWDVVQAQRLGNMDQLALGVILLRHQRKVGKHFHWEQPQRSNMFRTPLLQELYCQTLAAEFDMCQVGALKDPESQRLMKKGMTVMTTSTKLHQILHGRHCSRDHEHQPLEGTTKVQGKNISRTKFSGSYPRKFARCVAQALCQSHSTKDHPINAIQVILASDSGEPAMKRPRLSVRNSAAQPARVRRIQNPKPENPEKRRRITGKGGSIVRPVIAPNTPEQNPSTQATWQAVLDEITPQLPSVGRMEIEHPKVRERIQELIQPKMLHSIVAGRGLNRTTAPLKPTKIGEASYRMLVFVHRDTGKLEGVNQWEAWDQLPNRKIVRSGFPSRVAMTVFAANPHSSNTNSEVEASAERDLSLESTIPTPSDKVTQDEPTEEEPKEVHSPGPLFQQLSKEDQHLLMKIHKNYGHPGADKLAYLLKQQGFRPEMIAAVSDLRCASCDATRGPKISRPSAIHSPCDFNDSISMDGYTWTNKMGQQFHCYHIIDYSTNFHVAKYAPNRSVESAISCLQQAWFSWAGSPNELIIDAASELNAEAFSVFAQQSNVKCTTISTEAHWQNGRAERHGAILGSMLTKCEVDQPISSGHEFEQMLIHCTQAKNALSIRKGYPPEILVLGKSTRLPGSICSDHQLPAHAMADSENSHGLLFRAQLAQRERARKAFHEADNDQALRRAIVRRSRPARTWYNPGEWVMIWNNGNNPGWRGPMKVVQQESQQTVWVTQHGKLYRPAPEHVRPVTSIESATIDPFSANLPKECLPETSRPSQEPNMNNPSNPGDIPEEHRPRNNPEEQVGPTNPEPGNSQVSSDTEPMGEPDGIPIGNPPEGQHIPVPPTDTEDELVVGLYCQDEETPPILDTNQVWKGEIMIHQQDIDNWKSEETPLEMAFLVTAAKRQRSEVKLQTLDADARAQFEKAKQAEVNNWLSTQTVKRIFRNQIPEDQILRCRWLLSWKPVDPTEQRDQGAHKAKARLVVLGYLDPQLEETPRDSPTMSKTSRMMLLQLIASEGWDLMSFDIKAAFLQGQPQSSRVLGLEPVPELKRALQLKETEICQLVKGAYGLVDAPFLWYKTLQGALLSLGFTASPFDPCVFLLWDEQLSKPQGILGIHVDDGLCGGNEYFHEKIRSLEKKYPFGSRKLGNFTFTGIDLHQEPNKSIVLSQPAYIRKIKAIQIPQNRKDHEDLKITDEERQQLRGLIGSLQFASVNTRPDLASRLSNLQSQINSATVATLMQANRALHEAKRHHDVTVTIQSIETKQVRFLSFSDASFASRKAPTSQAGNIILATHQQIEKNVSCPVSPISWGSKKIQKVVTSTLAAEAMSLSSSLDQLSWIRLYWHWFQCPNDEWKHPIETLQKLPRAITSVTHREEALGEATSVVDCKSLFDLVTRTAPPNCQEFRTQLQAQAIKEQLAEGVGVRWVHSGAQLADSLTKIMESSFLRETMKRGYYKLNDEQEVLKNRASARNRIKWLKDSTTQEENTEA